VLVDSIKTNAFTYKNISTSKRGKKKKRIALKTIPPAKATCIGKESKKGKRREGAI